MFITNIISHDSIRGCIDAYIQAFDKHFNMLLVDADEEYITNKVYTSFSLLFFMSHYYILISISKRIGRVV
jgi:small nuclear ribonucleoprotein (snRNP)-like protein